MLLGVGREWFQNSGAFGLIYVIENCHSKTTIGAFLSDTKQSNGLSEIHVKFDLLKEIAWHMRSNLNFEDESNIRRCFTHIFHKINDL